MVPPAWAVRQIDVPRLTGRRRTAGLERRKMGKSMAHASRPEAGGLADLEQEIGNLAATPMVRSAYAWFRAQEAQLAGWQLEVARIPAPPFGEQERGQWLLQRFLELGLQEVHV